MKKWMTSAVLFLTALFVATQAQAGRHEDRMVEGLIIGVTAAVVGAAVVDSLTHDGHRYGDHKHGGHRYDGHRYDGHRYDGYNAVHVAPVRGCRDGRSGYGRHRHGKGGYWVIKKVWIPPVCCKKHRKWKKHARRGHWRHERGMRDGYWEKKRVWISY